MAAERAHERVPRDLGLLLHLGVRQRVVEDRELDHIGSQAGGEIALIRVECEQQRAGLQLLRHIGRLRIRVVGQEVVERLLVALERTLGNAVLVDVGADVEDVLVERLGARLLLLAQTILVLVVAALDLVIDPVVGAVAALGAELLVAEEKAGVARIVEAGLLDRLEELHVFERLDRLALLIDRAVAVLVGPLVELRVEAAHHIGHHAEAWREVEQRLGFGERIGRVVVDEYVEAALVGLRGERVGQAGVELEHERVARAVHVGLLELGRGAVGVEARVELIAGEKVRMKQVGERVGIARFVGVRAADDGERAHAFALGRAEVLAGRPLVPLLQRQHGVVRLVGVIGRAQVGLDHQRHGVVRVQWVHVADGDGGECGLELAEEAKVGRHLELEVVEEADGEQVDAEAEAE